MLKFTILFPILIVLFFLFFIFWVFFCFVLIYLFFIFGCVGSSFLCEGFLQLRQAGATLHRGAQAPHRRGPSRCGAQAPDTQAQQLWLTGLVAPRHVGSSQTRARTRVPCIGRQILNHCATREALIVLFSKTQLYPWSQLLIGEKESHSRSSIRELLYPDYVLGVCSGFWHKDEEIFILLIIFFSVLSGKRAQSS